MKAKIYWLFGLFLIVASCQIAPTEAGEDEMTVQQFLANLLKTESPARWRLFGSDGRLLDVEDINANHNGQSINLVPPLTTGASNISQILQARAKNPRNPETVTINLSIDSASFPLGTIVIPQAKITWGSGGALNTAVVDVAKGTQVTVSGTHVQVDGIYNANTVGANLPAIRMSADLSYGPRGNSSVAPGFTLLAVPVGGAASIFPVPNFAKDVTVYTALAAGASPADIRIKFSPEDAPLAFGGAIDQNEATAPNTVFPLTYPLPGYTRSVVVLNLGGVATSVTVRFGLAL